MNLFVRSIYLASALSLGYLFFLYRANPLRRLPGTTVTLCFVIGMLGVIPVEFVRLLLPLSTSGGPVTAFVTAGLVEEGVKFALLSGSIWRFSFPDLAEPIDAAIYFGALGLGFGVYEDFWYIFSSVYPAWSAGDVSEFHTAFTAIVLARALPGHVLFDGLAGFLVGYARFLKTQTRWWWLLGAFLLAVGAHGGYDLIARYGGTISLLTYIVLLIGIFLYLRTWALSRSPFRAVIDLITGERTDWPYAHSPIDYLFADGFSWPGKPRARMFQLFPLILSLVILYPLLFAVIYLINQGLILAIR